MTDKPFVLLVSPREPGLAVYGVLRDWSALGLVSDFLWIDAATLRAERSQIPALAISSGSARPVDIQSELALWGATDRIRVCVLDPLDGSPMHNHGDHVRSVLSSAAPTIRQTLVHCVLTTVGASSDLPPHVEQGWQGIVIAPEDSQTPSAPRRQIHSDEDPEALAMHYSAGVASVLGLWSGVDQSPLDSLRIGSAGQVRLVRGYLQALDASSVSASVRNDLTAVYPQLPRPVSDGRPLPRVDDEQGAARKSAEGLFSQNPWLLEKRREGLPVPTQESIGFRRAIAMFWGFLLAALKRAPKEWWERLVARGATRVASMTQKTVFGSDAEYAVVVRGRLPDGRLASLAEIVESSDRLLASLPPGARHDEASHDLTQFWRDFHSVGLDLADGAERVPGALPPRVGGRPAVVSRSAAIAAPPSESFVAIPPNVAASLGISRVSPADQLAAREVAIQLDDLEKSAGVAIDAGATRRELRAWGENVQRPCFAGQVGGRLGQSIHEIRTEIGDIRQRLMSLSEEKTPDSAFAERQKSLARRARWVFWIGVIAIVGLLLVGNRQWLLWGEVAKWAALAVVAEVVIQLFLYLRGQQALFQFLHRQEELEKVVEILLRNLAAAITDLRRLDAAYRQFVPVAEALGSFVSQPMGPEVPVPAGILLPDGPLPLSIKLGRIGYKAEELQPVLARMRAALFPVGWMTDPYAKFISHVSQVLGPGSEEFAHEPKLIFGDPASGESSPLRRWAEGLAEQGTSRELGDETWERVVAMLADPAFSPEQKGILQEATWTDGRPPTQGLGVQMTAESALLSEFDTAILKPQARAGAARRVDGSATMETHTSDGLSRLDLLVVCGEPFQIRDLDVQVIRPHEPPPESGDGPEVDLNI